MEKVNLWLAAIGALLTIGGMLWAAFWYVLKLWIRPLEAKIETLEATVKHLDKTLSDELDKVEKHLEKMDERHHHHTGDTAKHVSEQWRIEQQRQWDHLEKRLDRMEQGILTLLSAK